MTLGADAAGSRLAVDVPDLSLIQGAANAAKSTHSGSTGAQVIPLVSLPVTSDDEASPILFQWAGWVQTGSDAFSPPPAFQSIAAGVSMTLPGSLALSAGLALSSSVSYTNADLPVSNTIRTAGFYLSGLLIPPQPNTAYVFTLNHTFNKTQAGTALGATTQVGSTYVFLPLSRRS